MKTYRFKSPCPQAAQGRHGEGIRANGQVGINWDFTDNKPSIDNGYLLAVKGKIISEGDRVQLSTAPWPDYVFENKYSMLSLKEFEAYIYQYKHLPNLPTADEVKKEGIDLGEMKECIRGFT